MEQILSYLVETYAPKAILVYGSYADGSDNEHSDFDALVISGCQGRSHDMSMVNGVTLDVFVYPEADLKAVIDMESLVQIYHSKVVLDTEGVGEALRKQVMDYVDHLPVKEETEVFAEIEWCRKMVLRTRRKDAEGMFRWHWVLTDSLEIFCDAVGKRYWGPKKTLKWMESAYPEAFLSYQKALCSLDDKYLENWISCLEEVVASHRRKR